MTSAKNPAANSGRSARPTVGRPFQPGASGNPAGRPKVVEEFRARARRAVDETILDRWVAEVETKGEDWVKCSELLAAYGYGRPSQAIEVTADVTTHDTSAPLTNDERRAELKMHLAREAEKNAAAIAQGEPPPYSNRP